MHEGGGGGGGRRRRKEEIGQKRFGLFMV